MNKFIIMFLLFSGLFFAHTEGQTGLLKYFKDDAKNLEAVVHVTDTDGSTYLLVQSSTYYEGPAFPIEGGSSGLILYKLDKEGNKKWEKTVRGGRQIFINGEKLFIPYAVEGSCLSNAKSGNGWSSAAINCGLLINKADGSILENMCFHNKERIDHEHPFYYSDTCLDSHYLTAVLHKDNSIWYINWIDEVYKDELDEDNPHRRILESTHKIIAVKRDDTLGYAGETIRGTMKYPYAGNLVYDDVNNEYVAGDSTGLFVYDDDWHLVRKILLPHLEIFGAVTYKIAYNDNYYVINYGYDISSYMYRNYTAVYTKTGKQISLTESPHYDLLKITKDNIIYGMPQIKFQSSDTAIPPMSLIRMDIYQNVLGVKHIDKPDRTIGAGKDISFTNNNELIITGTIRVTIPPYRIRYPETVFYYKQKLEK